MENFKKSSTYVCILLYSFMTGVEYAIILPTIWQYLKEDFHASSWFMGFTLSSFSISGVCSGLLIGKLSDSYIRNTKKIMLITNTFEMIGNFIYFIAFDKWLLVASRFICGIGMGASAMLIAQIARHTQTSDRTSILTFIMGFRQIGLMLGPAFNIFLHKFNFTFIHLRVNYKNAPGFFMFFMWFFIQLFFWLFYVDMNNANNYTTNNTCYYYYDNDIDELESRPLDSMSTIGLTTSEISETEEENVNTSKTEKKKQASTTMIVLSATIFTTYFNQTALETALTPFTQNNFNWTEVENSMFLAWAGIQILLSYFLLRLLSTRLKDRVLLLFGLFLIIIALGFGSVYLHIVNNLQETGEKIKYFPAFAVFCVLDLIGLPFIAVSSMSLSTKKANDESQGLTQGMQRAVLGLGTILGPLVAGPLINEIDILLGFMLIFVFVLFVLLIIYFDLFDED
jgi:ceroid-lipofuscinosis MFS transporter 7